MGVRKGWGQTHGSDPSSSARSMCGAHARAKVWGQTHGSDPGSSARSMCGAYARAKVWGQTHGSDLGSSHSAAEALHGRVEDAEPARQILLHGELRLQLRLQLELLGVVPCLP